MDTLSTDTSIQPVRTFKWRMIDSVTATLIAVVAGVIFWLWGQVWTPISVPVMALLPGLQGLLNGPWLFAGVMAGLIIGKPGSALYGATFAALVSTGIGTQWGIMAIISGFIQGLGAELIFALFLYRSTRLWVAVLAGMASAAFGACVDLLYYYFGTDSSFKIVYFLSSLVSGAVVAGYLTWILVRALARKGSLARFPGWHEIE